MSDYTLALKEVDKASSLVKRAQVKLSNAIKAFDESKKDFELECGHCNKKTKVKDIEVVVRYSDGHRSYDHDDFDYNMQIIWVCPGCTSAYDAPTYGPFQKQNFHSATFLQCVKTVHEWYSDRERAYGPVLKLLGPHLEREAKRQNQFLRSIKVEQAKKLLKEEGIL